MNFIIFLLFLLPENSSQAMTTFYLLGLDRDCPTKTKTLDSAWSWRNLLLVHRKAWNQELTEILIQERIVTIFAVLRPEQHMAAQLTNIIFSSFFFPISHAHFICGILKLHTKCLLTPWHPSTPCLGCAVSQNPLVQLWEEWGHQKRMRSEAFWPFPVSIRKGQLLAFPGRTVFMLENS